MVDKELNMLNGLNQLNEDEGARRAPAPADSASRKTSVSSRPVISADSSSLNIHRLKRYRIYTKRKPPCSTATFFMVAAELILPGC